MKKESDFSILRKLFALFAKNNKSTIVASLILSFIDGVRPFIPIVLSGILIDGLATKKDYKTLLLYTGVGLLLILVFQVISAYLREYFNARVENCMERQNRDLNEQSMVIDYESLENPELQEKKRKQERVVNIRGGIYWMIIWPLDRGVTGLISVITAVIVAVPLFLSTSKAVEYGFFGSRLLDFIVFSLLILCAYVSYRTSRTWNKKFKLVFEEYSKSNKVSNYFLHNILFGSETAKDLRIFQQEDLVLSGVFGQKKKSGKALRRMRTLSMQEDCIEKLMSVICGGIVYLYAALKAFMGLISIGSVVRYASSIIKCIDGLVEVLFALSYWRQAADYGRDYLEYIEFQNKKKEGKIAIEAAEMNNTTGTAKDNNTVAGRKSENLVIEFKHVYFKYPGSDTYVIKDLNLKLDIREHMAIVGKNGSGKTTFIKLLCRLYDVTSGIIELNGIDIREYNYEDYMKLFAVVFQDYRMFSLKVGENIAASEDVDTERAIEALTRAGLKERIDRMEDGLDTYIGKDFSENGINVSGGERQKMAIARSIYKEAPFVIMDEPTAALDPVSECEVYGGFAEMVGNKAAIYISHRLASCRFCQDILVFDSGNVIQRGSHEQLVNQQGLYRQLWNAQAQYYNI